MNLYNPNTSNNQRLGSVLDDLDPRLSLLCQVGNDVIRPCKICGLWGMPDVRPKIHSFIGQLSHTIYTPMIIRSAFFLRQTQLVLSMASH